ncbi:MAG: NADH:flavin oxidoreductase/NADH oxidase [Chloroflexota bacterium]|nr:NADH:flavin oxidoreductase/NADH oxidase [Chloroflexota bacterium]
MSHLFDPLTIRSVTLRNRIGVSPMCQYSCENGMATDWHLVHLGSRAVGGAALVITEGTAVEARGRIAREDLGIWNDAHIEPLARITAFMRTHGAVPGIQLAHAGRKASTYRPWDTRRGVVPESDGGWAVVAPSAIPFSDSYGLPHELTPVQIAGIIDSFKTAAARAYKAGFQWIEVHAAHGYLIHEFLSPLSNTRTDSYGGSFENRTRLMIKIVRAIREVWAESLPLTVRLSCTDWVDGGWNIDETVQLAKLLKHEGVDLIDCSSGGLSSAQKIPTGAGYQVPFAERVRREANVATAAVGLITAPAHADEIIRNERADMVYLARELLRDPYWATHAAVALGHQDAMNVPSQYLRGY